MIDHPSAVLQPLYCNGSGDIKAGLHADGLAIHPAAIETLVAGSSVQFFPF